ncbi:hypothetical protein GCM10012284_39990 [Mangrovihabitans endophyticus]|uniref:Uncharacterized protein n=2 Tax=Mangrovihabitans endophyticus TaxID=1751298 RepID=A0A8J3FPS0_9ACTN|nr:hypothetical protein GCM10012284_39990 [Mangrovihabitans endophyticus]
MRAFARVARMSDNRVDPSGNTEAFRAFSDHTPQEQSASSRTPFVLGGVAIAFVVVLAVVLYLAL